MFLQAVMEFCNHPDLQYTWMRFLPDRDEHQYDPFWSHLITLMEEELQKNAVLRPRSEKSFRLISELRYLTDSQLDRHGNPLFRDVYPEKYLSRNYTREDINILRKYGLSSCSMDEILSAIEQDVKRKDSKIQSQKMDDDWHKKSASYLTNVCRQSNAAKSRLSHLPIIPLRDGLWLSTHRNEIYFPQTNEFEIPPDVDLSIIDPSAARNTERRQLFTLLGAQEAEISFIRHQILNKLSKFFKDNQPLSSYVRQLRYLFLTDAHKSSSEDKTKIAVMGSEEQAIFTPHSTDVYMPDNNPFGPSELLKEAKSTDGLSINFLHRAYVDGTFNEIGHDAMANLWNDWLCNYAGVRRYLRIISKDKRNLSEECQYIATHRPDKFLGYLRYTWKQEGKDIKSSTSLITKLREIPIRFRSYYGLDIPLQGTLLPLPKLERQWVKFTRVPECFPFLKLGEKITQDTYAKDWGFLDSLQFFSTDNLFFYIYMLGTIINTHKGEIRDPIRIFKLYRTIYGKYIQNPLAEQKARIRYVTLVLGLYFYIANS